MLSWIFIVLVHWNNSVAPLGHIILIPSQPIFALFPWCCVLSGEGTHTNFIVFGLTGSGMEPTIYHTRGEHANHYTTDAVSTFHKLVLHKCLTRIYEIQYQNKWSNSSLNGYAYICIYSDMKIRQDKYLIQYQQQYVQKPL